MEIILNKLREIISPYLEGPCEIEMETHLIQDLMINSFDYTNIIVDIEEVFNIEIDILGLHRTKDIVQYIYEASGIIKEE
ncbi:MAG: hypothetical protein FWE14_03150 [Lachnospiraceae bacterium]|nr:hypothetical protein [Lachnospiraceae bacterium]